jgi:hypothetical protein
MNYGPEAPKAGYYLLNQKKLTLYPIYGKVIIRKKV